MTKTKTSSVRRASWNPYEPYEAQACCIPSRIWVRIPLACTRHALVTIQIAAVDVATTKIPAPQSTPTNWWLKCNSHRIDSIMVRHRSQSSMGIWLPIVGSARAWLFRRQLAIGRNSMTAVKSNNENRFGIKSRGLLRLIFHLIEVNRWCVLSCRYIDVSLLKDPTFVGMCLSVTLMSVGCPYMLYFLPAYALSQGLSVSQFDSNSMMVACQFQDTPKKKQDFWLLSALVWIWLAAWDSVIYPICKYSIGRRLMSFGEWPQPSKA